MQFKRKKLIAGLCAASVVFSSAGGLPIKSENIFNADIPVSAEEKKTLNITASPKDNIIYDGSSLDISDFTFDGEDVSLINNSNTTITIEGDYKLVTGGTLVAGTYFKGAGTYTRISGTKGFASNSTTYYTGTKIKVDENGTVKLNGKNLGTLSSGQAWRVSNVGWSGGARVTRLTKVTLSSVPKYDLISAGTHIVIIKIDVGNDNYEPLTLTETVNIQKADVNAAVSLENWEYGETANEPLLTGETWGGTITYEYKKKDADDSTYSADVPTEVGDYTIRATVAETANSNGIQTTDDFSILSPPTYTVTIPETVSLGGAPVKVTISDMANIPSDKYVSVTIEGNDGEFSVKSSSDKLTYTVTGKQHNIYSDTDSQWNVEPETVVVQGNPDDSEEMTETELTFNAPAKEPEYAGEYSGKVTFKVSIDSKHNLGE